MQQETGPQEPGRIPTSETADPARHELLRQIEAALSLRLQGAAPEAARIFLERWAAGLSTEELAQRPAEERAAACLSLWQFAQTRMPGTVAIRAFDPRKHGEGWRSPFAVIEIVNDDMPFLVDSALGVLQQADQPVHALAHPVLGIARDVSGHMIHLQPADLQGGGMHESIIQIEFGPQADPTVLAQIEAALRRAMDDVRRTVADGAPMRARLNARADALADSPDRDFLHWMAEGNIVLLGARRLISTDGGPFLPLAGSGLGLLRDPLVSVFDTPHDTALAPAAVARFMAEPGGVAIAKADIRSTVHRPQLCDVIVVKGAPEDADGRVREIDLFLGLFAADVYNRNPRSIPLLREKVHAILTHAGVDPAGHDGRAMRNILDTWPRDDLFQGSEEEILAAARRVLELQVRPELALFLRQDRFGGHVSALVYVPRDRFDTRLRRELAAMVTRAFGGTLAGFAIAMADGPLARVQYLVVADAQHAGAVDARALQAAMAQAARSFRDRLADSLASEQGEAEAARTLAEWGDAFPDDYAARSTADAAVEDIGFATAALEGSASGRAGLQMALTRPPGMAGHQLALKLFNPGDPVKLSDILPLIETLGLRVVEEVPHRLQPRSGRRMALQTLTLETADGVGVDMQKRGADLLATLQAIWDGRAEADGFNRLVLRAGLTWREAWLLRAMFRWCRQVVVPFSQDAAEAALSAHPEAASLLVALFHARFDPAQLEQAGGSVDEAPLEARWAACLEAVASIDEDRILRRLRVLLDATLRTNFYRADATTDVIVLKIDSHRAGDMPLPRPLVEIWVHGARMEGCHLRGGKVARGGIRWSDRREDFRTEILSLMKAQMVKNVVIVPVGAKGGFVLKHPPVVTGDATRDREALQAEGVACYRLLINGMLDVTDTLREGRVLAPPAVVRRDANDPYLVVAADKGTATFSDTANAIAVERGFWLGDAFASGGSIGYDHKVMGITARGAWVNIARHFRELGHDIFTTDFTCVGVGDMSGDVFGNGLLITPHTKLLAAFDHRHVFLDPSPDPVASLAERRRLFALPRSSWADYSASLISEGGGVFPRAAKTIPLSAQAADMLGLPPGPCEPADVMRAILRMPADLLYFGGIGTYVKAADESDADAGDRANDALRIDGRALRVRVLGEGANLAITQAGRIEAAATGVRLNTDALDNSAGVSTSDHEVNIKILLADATETGRLTERQRVDLLAAMTDEVAALVLRDNAQQSQAISLDALSGAGDLPAQNALMGVLTAAGILDRAVAGLPDAASMAARATAGLKLSRPELCALMAYTKLWLAQVLDRSDLADDPALEPLLVAYFPTQLRDRFAAEIARHRLKRELIGTAVTNELINRLGPAAFARLLVDTGRPAPDVASALLIAEQAFGLPGIWTELEALDGPDVVTAQLNVLAILRRLHEAMARVLLGAADQLGAIGDAVAALRPGLADLASHAAGQARDSAAARALMAGGISAPLAALAAALPDLLAAPAIVRLAATAGVATQAASVAWASAGREFGIDLLRATLATLPPSGAWGARASATIQDDLSAVQFAFASMALRAETDAAALAERTTAAGQRAVALAQEAAATPDLAAAMVAVRALRALAHA